MYISRIYQLTVTTVVEISHFLDIDIGSLSNIQKTLNNNVGVVMEKLLNSKINDEVRKVESVQEPLIIF